jgi:hypothetical protein
MKIAVILTALMLSSPAARAADVNRALCRDNPALDRASFVVVHAREGEADKTWTLAFHHCALGGVEQARPMEVQRVYTDGRGQALSLTTQLGSLITTARLHPAELNKPAESAELGPFFTSDLLGAKGGVKLAIRERYTIRKAKPPAKAAK